MRFQWAGAPQTHLLRAGMPCCRDLVEFVHPYYVLVGFHGMPPVEMRDELWMSAHWFARGARRLLRGAAVIYSPE